MVHCDRFVGKIRDMFCFGKSCAITRLILGTDGGSFHGFWILSLVKKKKRELLS